MLLGFNAAMGAGKSEAVKVLKEYTSRQVDLVKFAQPLYDMQEYIYGRISPVIKRDASFVKDRKLLQWLGTEWGRDTISKTLWIDLFREQVKLIENRNLFGAEPIIVCDDVRFENEAHAFKELGGVIVQIRTTRNHERIDTSAGYKNHSSEAGFDPSLVDHVIDNDASLHEYQITLRALYEKLGIKR